jgi:hypothetical protein
MAGPRTSRLRSPSTLRRRRAWGAPLPIPSGTAYLIDRLSLEGLEEWKRVWTGVRHDSRYYEILDATIPPFQYHYLVLEDGAGRVRAVQPLFVSVQDVLQGLPERPRRIATLLTRMAPALARFRTLWVGPTVGEAALGAEAGDCIWSSRALVEALPLVSRQLRAPMIVLKDFPSPWRFPLQIFVENGYTRIPSMPSVVMDLNFKNFDEYLKSLSQRARGDLRRKFRQAGRLPPVTVEVVNDISDRIEELYPLYLQVHQNSPLRFETLTPEYFRRLGREIPERSRFFIWSQEGRPVAFDACTLFERELWADVMGLDYRVALDLHLYFIVKRDVIEWACRNGVRRYHSGQLNYDPKLRLDFKLEPLDLYLWHRNPVANEILRRAAPWLTPARHDPLLRKFSNAAEL